MDNEFEGVEMARRAIKRREERDVQRKCIHPRLEVRRYDRHTQDARLERVAEYSCPDCGFFSRRVEWKQPIPKETVRRL